MTWRKKRPTIADILNGAIAGLAGITPCAGFVYPWAALIIAIVIGASSFEAVEILRFRWGLDDALDVSSVHGVTGIVGSIAIAFAANTKIGGHETGLVYGVDLGDSAKLLGVQLLAVVVTGAYSAIVTYGILKAFKRFGLYPSFDDLDSDEDDHNHGQRDFL
jgi:Amt family ammonium transporter